MIGGGNTYFPGYETNVNGFQLVPITPVSLSGTNFVVMASS